MALLPPRFQKAVAFVYIKNRTLFVALSHPGFKMELNYNKELFKELLGTLAEYTPECKDMTVDSVVFFDSKYHMPKETIAQDTIPHYSELSSGEFEIKLEDEALREKFLRSQEIISQNLNNQDD